MSSELVDRLLANLGDSIAHTSRYRKPFLEIDLML